MIKKTRSSHLPPTRVYTTTMRASNPSLKKRRSPVESLLRETPGILAGRALWWVLGTLPPIWMVISMEQVGKCSRKVTISMIIEKVFRRVNPPRFRSWVLLLPQLVSSRLSSAPVSCSYRTTSMRQVCSPCPQSWRFPSSSHSTAWISSCSAPTNTVIHSLTLPRQPMVSAWELWLRF